MKRIYFFVLVNVLSLNFLYAHLYAQSIDKSLYQEVHLSEAYKIRENNPQGTQYYKSLAHFRDAEYNNFMGWTQVIFYEKGSQYTSFIYYSNFPDLRPFQIVVIYYRFIHKSNGSFDSVLDHIELVDRYLIVGTRYKAMENLRLRNKGSLSGEIIQIIKRDEWIIVLEEGNEETIDGKTSIWVKVRLNDNTEGWCFGGYLGLDFLRN
jgi:hypothetical protein